MDVVITGSLSISLEYSKICLGKSSRSLLATTLMPEKQNFDSLQKRLERLEIWKVFLSQWYACYTPTWTAGEILIRSGETNVLTQMSSVNFMVNLNTAN